MLPAPLPDLPMRASLPLLAALLLTGCTTLAPPASTTATSPGVTASAATAPHLEIQWTRTSAEHDALFEQTYRLAGYRLQRMSDTLSGDWGVILDADETVLDNSLYQRERAAIGEGFSSESWAAWVERRAATALPGAVTFTSLVAQLGGRVVIVTNRSEAGCPATRANLASAGIVAAAVLCQTGPGDKNPRFAAVAAGTEGLPPLRVAMWLGDNIQDFPALSQTSRTGDFGGRFWVLPNPMYGSWTRNPDPADAP